MSVTKSKRNFFLSKDNLWIVGIFMVFSAVMYFFLWASGTEEDSVTERLLIVLFFDGIIGIIVFLMLLINYTMIGKLINDKSERSIIPLFDNGYSTLHGNFRHIFKDICLKGTISGLPITVTIENIAGRQSQPAVKFTFYPLAHLFKGREIEMSVEYKMNFRKRLKGDIKPEVLKFVEDLKSKGYVADEEA
jgi:hypothetical protein